MNLSQTLQHRPILIIDDDEDEHFLMSNAFSDLQTANERIYFTESEQALDYLRITEQIPLLIICDLMMPKKDGIQLKQQIDQDYELRQKSIPFVFMSSAASASTITQAYTQLTIQGVFIKPMEYEQFKVMLQCLIQYWTLCEHPIPGANA